jgi:putative membrane protein
VNRKSLIAMGALLASIAPASAQQDYGPWRMHEWMGWGWGGMFLGPLFMIFWIAVLVAVVVLVLRWLGVRSLGTGSSPRTSREILDERYARGEIEREEYLRRRQDIDAK